MDQNEHLVVCPILYQFVLYKQFPNGQVDKSSNMNLLIFFLKKKTLNNNWSLSPAWKGRSCAKTLAWIKE